MCFYKYRLQLTIVEKSGQELQKERLLAHPQLRAERSARCLAGAQFHFPTPPRLPLLSSWERSRLHLDILSHRFVHRPTHCR